MPSDSALIGRTLAGRYTITGHIGEGGFASVYRGVQEAEPRDVALKVMSEKLAANRTFARRFKREARAAVRLNHPRIVQVIEYGEDAGLLFIAMELLVGHDLFEALLRERRMPEARAVRLVAQVCDALAAAHDLGIVHRDLKPENVMIVADSAADGGERVKVLDFGIAKILESGPEEKPQPPPDEDPPSSSRSALTRAGTVMGTPAYMSPEQGRAEPIDGRSDLYACGVLLYQLVTGRLPFDGETALQIIMQHVNERPRPPRELVPSLNRALEATILRALSKYPSERQKSARDLRDDLLGALPSLSAGRHKTHAPPSSVILGGPASPPLGADTPAVPTPVTPSSDSTRTMIRDVSALPAPEPPEPPAPHHHDTAPTPLVVDVSRAAPASAAAPSQPASSAISTLRSRMEDVTPFVGSVAAAPPPAPTQNELPRPRLPPAVALGLGLLLGLICFVLLALVAVVILR